MCHNPLMRFACFASLVTRHPAAMTAGPVLECKPHSHSVEIHNCWPIAEMRRPASPGKRDDSDHTERPPITAGTSKNRHGSIVPNP